MPLSPHGCSPCLWGFILYLLHYQHFIAIVGGSRGEGLCSIHYVFLEATFLSLCIFMCKMKTMTPSFQGHYEDLIIGLGTLPSTGDGHSNIVFLPLLLPLLHQTPAVGWLIAFHLQPQARALDASSEVFPATTIHCSLLPSAGLPASLSSASSPPQRGVCKDLELWPLSSRCPQSVECPFLNS